MVEVLITGGAGYIGSHTLIELVKAGYAPVVVDNFVNSKPEAMKRVEALCSCKIPFYEADVRDKESLRAIFSAHSIKAVIHFAGLKAVGESVEKPLEYYDNNIGSTLALIEIMKEFSVTAFVFSSSATVYGASEVMPLTEDLPTSNCTNPYGWTKLMNEIILKDICVAHKDWSVVLLRYFNPIGAHESGTIGENPQGIPNNIMPYITQVAVGRLERLRVFGNDYPTVDGTGVRDYIHVVDLAKGHCKALEYALNNVGAETINLGTGSGVSVLELIASFEKNSGKTIPYIITERRAGDIATCYSDPTKAKKLLNWVAEKNIDDMCKDGWRFQKSNPEGY